MQRFPQIDENVSNNFRSTDFITKNIPPTKPKPVQQTIKQDITISINRSRSCSGGRKKTLSPPILTRKGIFISSIENKSSIISRYIYI